MASESMNLNPQERRLVVGVGLVVFIVLNIVFVWPRFGDWRKIVNERGEAERKLARYEKEVAQLPRLQERLQDLEASGPSVAEEDRDLDLANVVRLKAQSHRLEIIRNDPVSAGTTTNQFFDEKAVMLQYNADTTNLVNFLNSLTDTNSLIRVQELSVRPVPPNAPLKLSGQIRLVASYQRKVPAAAPASTPAVASNSQPAAAQPTNPPSVTIPKRVVPTVPK